MTGLDRFGTLGEEITVARVGFGCSNLLGDKTREAGLALLNAAYDSGIRHYDVARVYNFGDAEALVGEFSLGKRDRITITTKFGLKPRAGIAKYRGPISLVRSLMRSSPLVRKLVRRNVKTLVQAAQFDANGAQSSLETSLRTLKTDYIDAYLMHESAESDCTDEMLAFLHRAKSAGKILSFGCGTAFQKIPAIAKNRPEFLEFAQFESSLTAPNVELFEQFRPLHNRVCTTHGAMSVGGELTRRLTSDPSLMKRWFAATGIDVKYGQNLYALLLYQALRDNPGGLVVFRTAAPLRIGRMLKAMEEIHLSDDQAAALKAIGAELRRESLYEARVTAEPEQ